VCFSDVDWIGDIDMRRSTLGYMVTFARGVVSWQWKLQKCVALSTKEAEYIVVIEVNKEMLWMKQFLKEPGQTHQEYIIQCDN